MSDSSARQPVGVYIGLGALALVLLGVIFWSGGGKPSPPTAPPASVSALPAVVAASSGPTPTGQWTGTLKWTGADTKQMSWTLSRDGSMVTSFGEQGSWVWNGSKIEVGFIGKPGKDHIDFVGEMNGDQLYGSIHSDYQSGYDGTFQASRGAAMPPPPPPPPVPAAADTSSVAGVWTGTIKWTNADTAKMTWTLNSDGGMVTGFGEKGSWTQSGDSVSISLTTTSGHHVNFSGQISGGALSGQVHSDLDKGYDGTLEATRG